MMAANYMSHGELQGTHTPSFDGKCLTIQDLLDFLKTIPPQARHNYISLRGLDGESTELTGIQFSQRTQQEHWDFGVCLIP